MKKAFTYFINQNRMKRFFSVMSLTLCLLLVGGHVSLLLADPIANDDAATTFANVPLTISVINNDTGNNLLVEVITEPAHGQTIVTAANAITYTPQSGFVGNDSFLYRLTDTETGASDIANVSITIQETVAGQITALDDVAYTVVDAPIVIDVLSNDLGEGIEVAAIAALPINGNVIINADGTITYTPTAGFVGSDQFAYILSGTSGNTDIGMVNVMVEDPINIGEPAGNQPPVSVTLEYCTGPMQPVIICEDWYDPNGDGTWIDIEQSNTTFHCSLNPVAGTDTCLKYTPLPGFYGVDTITIVVCDDQTPSLCSTSIALVHVGSGCIAPTAASDVLSIDDGIFIFNGNVTATENPYQGVLMPILANDENVCGGSDLLSVSQILQQPLHGTAGINGTTVSYDPDPLFSGSDQLQYIVCNQCGLCDTATVSIQVSPQDICAEEINICIGPFTATPICPAFCTIEASQAASLDAEATQGAILPSGEGCYSFMPPAVSAGTADVVFTACNEAGTCEVFTVHVTIDAICGDNAPIAQDDQISLNAGASVPISVLNNDSDADGQTLSLSSILSQPDCGTATVVGNTIVYAAANNCAGVYEFPYIVCDPTGLCDTAMVAVTVTADEPEPCDNQTEYCTTPFNPSDLSYLSICVQFCDLQGPGVHIVDANTTFHCSIGLVNDSCITYLPLPGFTGLDTIAIYGCNDAGQCDTIHINVHVGCTEPTAINDVLSMTSGQTTATIPVLDNDSDICGNPLTVNLLNQPAHGIATANADGTITYTPNAGYSGTDVFTYESCTPCATGPVCDEATVTITIPPPVSVTFDPQPDIASTPFNTAVTINVLSNDGGTNPDVTGIVIDPLHGTAVSNANNTITYTPSAGYSGTDYFFYEVCNNSTCETVLVTVTVLPEGINNQAPQANNDVASTTPTNPVTIPVLANDHDPENNPLTVTQIDQAPQHGTVGINPDGTVVYTPTNPNYTGTDSFSYVVCDNLGECTTATVTITINADGTGTTNDPPLAVNDDATTMANTPVTISPVSNDTDPNVGDILTITVVSDPLHGTLGPIVGNSVNYTPDSNFDGTDYFSYIVCDNGTPVLCDTAWVTVSVGSGNQGPVAQDDTVQIDEGNSIEIPVLDNDNDPDNPDSDLTVNVIMQPANGTATVTLDGTIIYEPDENFTGTDVFEYTVCDPIGVCDTATVTVTVLAPINAQPDIASTEENTPVEIPVLSNDEGNGITLTTVSDIPQNGAIIDADPETGVITYQPNPGFVGTDDFMYVICDVDGNCDTTLVSITVLPAEVGNLAPIANNDQATTPLNTPVDIPVLSNDNDPNNDPIIVTTISEIPENGSVAINPDGTITYTPDESTTPFCDMFAYIVCDNGSPALCDTAFVQVSVGTNDCLNQPPIANDDDATTDMNEPVLIDVTDNDQDPDGTITTTFIGAQPTNGIAEMVGQDILYTPNEDFVGTDYFQYVICDNGTPSLCDTAYITVTVNPEAIDAQPDIVYTNEDTPITFDVTTNDAGVGIEVTAIMSGPANGTLTINPLDGTVSYQPDTDFTGTDYFEYQICDDGGNCDITLVTIYVLPDTISNLPPNAVNDLASTPLNTPVFVDVLVNDNDPLGGDNITIMNNTNPTNGTVQQTSGNGFTYTPASGFAGIDSFTYVICDNGMPQLCDTATVVITVEDGSPNPSNLPPVAIDDFVMTMIDVPIVIVPLSNDFDPDADPICNVFVSDPANGTAQIVDCETVTYTPDMGFVGTDYFSYIICDNGSPQLCDTAYVTVVIDGDNPIDSEEIYLITPEDTPITVCPQDSITVGGFDIDTLIVTMVPDSGLITIDTLTDCITYLPNTDFTGDDHVMLQACDANGNCIPVDIFITVTPVSDNPIAINDYDTTAVNTPVTISVLDNDYDPDGDPLTGVMITTLPSVPGATAVVNLTDLTTTYTPATDFVGIDSFAYVIFDLTGGLSDTAWVYVTIGDPDQLNDVLTATDDDSATDMNTPVNVPVFDNDIVPDNVEVLDTFITIVQDPMNGTATANDDLTIDYTPNDGFSGTDTLEYQLCIFTADLDTICDTAQVVISVIPAEITAVDDASATQQEVAVDIDVLNNDLFPNIPTSDTTIVIIDAPSNGTATLNDDLTSIHYLPNNGFSGTDTLQYQLCVTLNNGEQLCDTAQVIITVIPDNCGDLVFAGAFSPNGDGVNDLYLIQGVDDDCREDMQLIIFNRWGDIVYQEDNYDNTKSWNGKLKGTGVDVPDYTYFYIFRYTENDIPKDIQGCFEVRR